MSEQGEQSEQTTGLSAPLQKLIEAYHTQFLTRSQAMAMAKTMGIRPVDAALAVDMQEYYQRYAAKGPKQVLLPTQATAQPGFYQADLVFIPYRGDLRPVLVMIEVTTRKGYFRALKDKSSAATAEAINSILAEADPPVKSVRWDQGTEFKGDVARMFKAKGIDGQGTVARDKTTTGMVERFNRTVRELILRYRATVSPNWLGAVQQLQDVYNKRPLRVLGDRAPSDISPGEADIIRYSAQQSGRTAAYKRLLSTFKPGDTVRVREEGPALGRQEQRWSKATYTVEDVSGVRVALTDGQRKSPRDLLRIQGTMQYKAVAPEVSEEARKVKRRFAIDLRRIDAKPPSKELAALQQEQGGPAQAPQRRARTAPTPFDEAQEAAARAQQATKASKTKKGPRVYEISEVRGHEYRDVGGVRTLYLRVKYTHLDEEKNKKYEWQPAANFVSDVDGVRVVNSVVAAYAKKQRLKV